MAQQEPIEADHRRRTRSAYDADAVGWTARSKARRVELAAELANKVEGPILDLGCGPGWHLDALGPRSFGLDFSAKMTRLARSHGPIVQADMTHLPLTSGSIAGVWASRSLVHLPRPEVPMALAELHRATRVDGLAYIWLFEGDHERIVRPDDSLPGRTYSYWPPEMLRRVFVGAGFDVDEYETWESETGISQVVVKARRAWTLPDYVGPDMRLLICGLNPSPASSDGRVGFFRAGNRFWPAALQAGIVSRDRDPRHALSEHGIGMTDLVKRTTPRADQLTTAEYRTGVERVEELVRWLKPQAICMVGLAGWRAAVDRKAGRGWQPNSFGGRPVYVMPSTSGLNAHSTLDSLAAHLSAAALGP